MTCKEEAEWPIINPNDKLKLQNQNLEFSEFLKILIDGQKIAILIVTEISSYIENKTQALQRYIPEEIKEPNEIDQILGNGRFGHENQNEQVHVN